MYEFYKKNKRIAAQQKNEILKEYHQTLEPTEAEYKEALLAAKRNYSTPRTI